MIPVNLSALAPVEIVPIDPFVVSSSMNGVVEKILVSPNQTVAAGQPLVHLDDTEVRNSVAIAVEALEVAKVQLEKVERGAFINTQSGEMMAELTAQVDLRNAELTFARERLKKSLLTSEKSGVAVVNQPDAWAGRPVSTGEKILQIADPDQVELQIMLPVADAVLLSSGNRVRIFLDSAPLSPKEAQIVRSEYEAYPTESGILSYRVTARFTDTEEHPRIGLRGTAKVFGKQVSLFYYLFRRPITAFRQWTGW
jgi:multidrug efflux pump subunit AcrA (membrane-fusion protein)